MAKLYSLDLRERVAVFALAKGSTRLAAEMFSVSKATAVRWAKQLRDTGNVAIGDVGGHRPAILRSERVWLANRIAAEPHVSLRKLLSDLQVRGIAVSYGALWNFVGSVRNLVRGAIVITRRESHGYRERTIGPAFGWPRPEGAVCQERFAG